MKSFKKLFVTLLALVLLISGAVVVSIAASTPAQIVSDARVLLDQAVREDEYIATRSQKMRELDRLIEANFAHIKNSAEWRGFQIEYRAAQAQLKEDCLAEANGLFERLMDRQTDTAEAKTIYQGLTTLISTVGDTRGYFDVDSAEFIALKNRLKPAQAIAKLQEAEGMGLVRDKGACLLWIDNYKRTELDGDETSMSTVEYTLIDDWFADVYAAVEVALYQSVRSAVAEAARASTSYVRAMALASEINGYFADCYFDTTNPEFEEIRALGYYAEAYAYLNEIQRNASLVQKGAYLKTLVAYVNSAPLSTCREEYEVFGALYKAMLDTSNPASVLSALYAQANAYKQQIAEPFTAGYTGTTSTEALFAKHEALVTLVNSGYFPDAAYANDVVIAEVYVGLYNFYSTFSVKAKTAQETIERNRLFKDAAALYRAKSSAIMFGSQDYMEAFLAVYNDLTARASEEIYALLDDLWLKPAKDCENKNNDESYVYTIDEIIAAYKNLDTYYIQSATALYYGAISNPQKAGEIQDAMRAVEMRLVRDIKQALEDIDALVDIPDEELAEVDYQGLQARMRAQDALVASVDGFIYTYADAQEVSRLYHRIIVGIMLSKLCEVEYELKRGGSDTSAAIFKYNAFKAYVAEKTNKIITTEEDYKTFLALKNKTDVKMGDVFVPSARELLEKLEDVINKPTFDKVYALMRVDEFIRQNGITRPADGTNTTSQTALFYQDYDVLAKKVADFRAEKVAEREANVPISQYADAVYSFYDMEKSALGAFKNNHVLHSNDKRHYGADGSATYMTFEYKKGISEDGYILLYPAATGGENIVFEMSFTTFDYWPTTGVSFSSKANDINTGAVVWPWFGCINGSGQLEVITSSGRKTITNREGGYIVPGQWTRVILVYNAENKTVSYYINDEKIVDAEGNDTFTCASGSGYILNAPLRIGHTQSGGGSFSLDSVSSYVGDRPRDVHRLSGMSDLEKFAFYTQVVTNYIDKGLGTATDAKLALDELKGTIGRYWGVPAESEDDTPRYLFDANTYWDETAEGYVDPGITYLEFKDTVDICKGILDRATAELENAMKDTVLSKLRADIAQLERLTGMTNFAQRKELLAAINTYIEENLNYIGLFEGAMLAEYENLIERKDLVSIQMDTYERVDEYIKVVNKLVAARDLYSRTVYRSQAKGLMDIMERDDALGAIDLAALKSTIPEFVAAIATFGQQSALVDEALLRDNNDIIVECMSRFPAVAEDAILEYERLNTYMVLVRRIIAEGSYDPEDPLVKEALVVYERMNALFFERLQQDHAKTLQEMIDNFNVEPSYITRYGIYKAVKAYFEENEDVIDPENDAIKTILSQYELMEEKFGTEEGREREWELYGETLKVNADRFTTMVTEMRLCNSYAELHELVERASEFFYYMEATDAEAKLAVEYYQACESILAQKALCGDIFIESVYALSKTSKMKDVYSALIVASKAYAEADVTYDGVISFTEHLGGATYTVDYTMEQAINQYLAILASYNSFVTVVNEEVGTALDVVCSVRASFAINQPVVALFKKIYD